LIDTLALVPESTDDFALLERWRQGDNLAGQALFERYFDSISRFFENKCPAEADELVQATFFACVRAVHQFRKESSFRTYLFTIARHQLYRLLRERQRNANVDFEVSSIAQLATTPGTLLDRNQEKQRMIEALRELPVAQQTLLELHYWEHVEIAELAEIFELEPAAIRQRLHRARVALRDQMLAGRPAPKQLETLETLDVWAKSLAG
jgi:RNA polymerase sigma-70 factor (ECF subfamily)